MIYYAFLLFFVLEYVRPGNYMPALNTLNSLVPLSIIAGTFVTRSKVSNQDVVSETNGKILGTFLGLILISVPTAAVTLYAYNVMTAVVGYILIFWVIRRQLTSRARIMGVFLMMLLVHVVVVGLNPVLITAPETRNYVVAGPFLGDGNDLALSLNIVLPFTLLLIVDSRRWYVRAFFIGLLTLLVLCIVLTKSRGGTLALIAVALYYWWNSDRKVLTATIAAVAVVAVMAVAPASYFDRMRMIADTQEGSAEGRILAWTAGVKMAIANPLLGAGAGMFAVTYGEFYRTRYDIPWQSAHSIYFLALGELGVPGITVLLTFILGNLSQNKKLRRKLNPRLPADASDRRLLVALSASLVAFATGGAFLSALYYPHIYVLAGLLSASRYVVRERLASVEADAAPEIERAKPSVRPSALSPEWRPRRALGAIDTGQIQGRTS